MSPMRVVMNAFFAAAAALGRSIQKPMSKYDASPDEFPKHEKQQQTVRDDHAEHRAGKERQIREETGEILVVSHVADAEDKNAQADQ